MMTEKKTLSICKPLTRKSNMRFSLMTLKNYPKFKIKKISPIDKVGVINGLYATTAGIGGITIIETYRK